MTDNKDKKFDVQPVREKRKKDDCPFCSGNESMTPPEIRAIRNPKTKPNTPGWEVRVVPDKFAVLRIEETIERDGEGGVYDFMNGVGAHEIIIEHPDHYLDMDDYSDEHRIKVFKTYKERIEDLYKDKRFRYVQVFKNYGHMAGGSIDHPHSQIVAMPVNPRRLKNELRFCADHYKLKQRCLFCDIIHHETRNKTRIVLDNEHFIAFEPFTSRFPYETWILPKRHDCNYTKITNEELKSLSVLFKQIITVLKKTLSDPAYNMMLYTAPNTIPRKDYWQTIEDDHHWHLEIIPRLMRTTGFEWSTGLHINPILPEYACEVLKKML
jgi:UDPglucose--hexose-1-phosphate uridylyltransferase